MTDEDRRSRNEGSKHMDHIRTNLIHLLQEYGVDESLIPVFVELAVRVLADILSRNIGKTVYPLPDTDSELNARIEKIESTLKEIVDRLPPSDIPPDGDGTEKP